MTAAAVEVSIDQIQMVDGIESLLVASKSPLLLNSIRDIPIFKLSAAASEVCVGGHAGCGAEI